MPNKALTRHLRMPYSVFSVQLTSMLSLMLVDGETCRGEPCREMATSPSRGFLLMVPIGRGARGSNLGVTNICCENCGGRPTFKGVTNGSCGEGGSVTIIAATVFASFSFMSHCGITINWDCSLTYHILALLTSGARWRHILTLAGP